MSKIQEFYKDKTVFITGGTGLVGKVLVEKLLRSCPDVNRIILTIRPKRNTNIENRISNFFDDELFHIIRDKNPSAMKKIEFISTMLDENNLGLNSTECEFIKTTVNIIFHSAATVRFNAPLSEAVNSNVKITKNIIDLAKEMKELEAFIYVSTAWSHAIKEYIEEKVQNLSHRPEFLFNLVDNVNETILLNITPSLLDKWPNTYLMTKNVSECMVAEEMDNIPRAIFRPGLVTPTYQEPIPIWMNSVQAVTLYAVGIVTGTIRAVLSKMEYNLHSVPADFVANCMIALAWDTALKNRKELKIYNYIPVTNPCIQRNVYDRFVNTRYPLEGTIWKPGYIATTSKRLFSIYAFLLHTVPAYIGDTILTVMKKKPVLRQIAERTNKMLESCSFFTINHFKFEFKNVPALWDTLTPEDQNIFNFDLNSIDWDEYIELWTKGTKTFLKEDFKNINTCKTKRLKLQIVHYGILILLIIFGINLMIFFTYLLGF